MIILDTHIWIWYVQGDQRLGNERTELIRQHEADEIGVCSISIWEVAKAVELRRLTLPVAIHDWFAIALDQPGFVMLPLSPAIAIESTNLPGDFHKDPFDQIIVASARIHDSALITADRQILKYSHVKLLP